VCSLDLSAAPNDVIIALVGKMDLQQRFTCALVCSDWARAAAAAVATNSIVKHGLQDLAQLQQWLDKHDCQVETLQLRDCSCTLARLPCAQLQDLLLHGLRRRFHYGTLALVLDSKVWRDIAAATRLTSLSLDKVSTTARQADVVSALTTLPDLQQLIWGEVDARECDVDPMELSDSRLLQQLTRLTGLELRSVAAEALQHQAAAPQHALTS